MDKDIERRFREITDKRKIEKILDYSVSIFWGLLIVMGVILLATWKMVDGVNERLDRIERALDVDAAVSLGSSLTVCDTLLTE